MSGPELYIETKIDADIEDLWAATQTPDEHERWDLRFTDINYLPRPDEDEPQQFTYTTELGFGIGVSGGGESTGDHRADGARTSALRFWSDDLTSLITEGTGYWKYLPEDGGVRFLTAYNYETRYGRVGRAVDRLVFRPLMVWGTAWSFDRLRLWLEEDVSPEASMQRSLVHSLARISLAFVWLFAGIVPKLAGPHPAERELSGAMLPAGVPLDAAIYALGLAEVGLGVLLLVAWHRRWVFLVSGVFAVFVTGGGIVAQPALFGHPLSPVPAGVAMVALAVVGYVSARDLPSARRCITDRAESDRR